MLPSKRTSLITQLNSSPQKSLYYIFLEAYSNYTLSLVLVFSLTRKKSVLFIATISNNQNYDNTTVKTQKSVLNK